MMSGGRSGSVKFFDSFCMLRFGVIVFFFFFFIEWLCVFSTYTCKNPSIYPLSSSPTSPSSSPPDSP